MIPAFFYIFLPNNIIQNYNHFVSVLYIDRNFWDVPKAYHKEQEIEQCNSIESTKIRIHKRYITLFSCTNLD